MISAEICSICVMLYGTMVLDALKLSVGSNAIQGLGLGCIVFLPKMQNHMLHCNQSISVLLHDCITILYSLSLSLSLSWAESLGIVDGTWRA
jgi:hypothetical protein